jgi:L-ascorbate metabolism protein UlaG (beta-lactamase superfamily)
MRTIPAALGVFCLIGLALIGVPSEVNPLSRVTWYGQSAVRVTGTSGTVFVDPFRMPDSVKGTGDLILVTHAHFDHLSAEDIEKAGKAGCPVYGPEEVVKAFPGRGIAVEPGETYEAKGFTFRTVPAYNLSKKYHPQSKGWVGYILVVDGDTYYFAGDTDFIPEMKGLRPTVAFLPIGGTYTMDWEEAVKAAEAVAASITVPYHWGAIEGVGTKKDAEAFQKSLPGRTAILESVQE